MYQRSKPKPLTFSVAGTCVCWWLRVNMPYLRETNIIMGTKNEREEVARNEREEVERNEREEVECVAHCKRMVKLTLVALKDENSIPAKKVFWSASNT